MSQHTPHPHAAVIKAWADGMPVQYREPGCSEWVDVRMFDERCFNTPRFYYNYEYRIKPATIKYRNFLRETSSGRLAICVVTEEDQKCEPRESWARFIKWLGDWQEVEVES